MNRKSLQLLLHRTLNPLQLTQIHARASTLGLLYTDQPLASKLLDAYSKQGNPTYAHQVFDKIPQPDIVSYTSLINLHLQTHQPDKSLSVFSTIISVGLRPDSFAVVGALSACGKKRDLVNGKIVHGMGIVCGVGLVPIVGNVLIDMYFRNGEVEMGCLVFEKMCVRNVSSWTSLLNGFVLCDDLVAARKVFDEMPEKNDVAWTAMVTGYVRGNMPVQGLELFKRMMDEGERLIMCITIVGVLSGCADIGALDHGRAIHGFVLKVCFNRNGYVANALMDMYSKGGCPELAARIFCALNKKDVFSWTTMISGYAFQGQGSRALEIFNDMLTSGVLPNDISVLAVLAACSHRGLVAEAQSVFNEMVHCYNFEPKIEHYGCMVDLLGRAGMLEEAKELIEIMPIDPDAIVLRSLLSASLVHGNLDLAEMVGKKIIQLQPDDDGVYVLLWNMYFACNRKEDARLMRKMMSDRKVKKKTASSWVELNGVSHEFVSEGSGNHASAEVYEVLKMISLHFKSESDICN